jgi:putative hydrolase of HD superfamily
MADLKLRRVIDIQKLILKLRAIERITYNPQAGYENDVEHSFSLAFMAWLMAPKVAPHLDFYKLQTYAMIHDLVEVYAGDTFCFAGDDELNSKPEREACALNKLVEEFKDFPTLIKALNDYDKLADEEARFVYALDKLQPIILNYLDGGRVWHENHISFEEMFTNKLGKTAVHPAVHRYVIEMAELMLHEPDIFPRSEEARMRLVYQP